MAKLDDMPERKSVKVRSVGARNSDAHDRVWTGRDNAEASHHNTHSINSRRPASGHDHATTALRGRETIYVDADDDITSIVSKIKNSNETIVALVPPAARGVLHSVVNLKLIERAAENADKKLTLVTTDPVLTNMAAGLGVAVARSINAQAKVPDMNDDQNDDDIIDGRDLSIGDLDRTANRREIPEDKDISAAVASIEADDRMHNDSDGDDVNDDDQPRTNTRAPKRRKDIPDFNSFRKKLLIGGGLAVILIGFLVWAIVFAPFATITIKAKTVSKVVNADLSLVPNAELDVDAGRLAPIVKTKKSTETAEFDATGSREEGDKAKGTVAFCYKTDGSDPTQKEEVTVPAGTRLYANGVQFSTDAAVTLKPGYTDGSEQCETFYSVGATAVTYGEKGNISENTQFSISGFSSESVGSTAKTDFTGGSTRTVKFVQQSDVDNAVQKLKDNLDADTVQNELKDQIGSDAIVIKDSFGRDFGVAKSSPAVGAVADGKASVSVEVSYSLLGVSRSDISKIVEQRLLADVEGNKIYDNGLSNVNFRNFKTARRGYSVSLSTTGHIGPTIDEDKVKADAVGKKSEEIKASLTSSTGVSDVTVQMGPFWVSKAPATDKIKVNFTIDQ